MLCGIGSKLELALQSRLFEHVLVPLKILQCSAVHTRDLCFTIYKVHHEHHPSFVQIGPIVSLPTAVPAGRCMGIFKNDHSRL